MSKVKLESEIVELKSENRVLKETITGLLEEINRLRHIELQEVDPNLPTEEQIIIQQINYFGAVSRERQLSLDENRALDLLLKNKRLIDDKKPKKDDNGLPEGTTTGDLLKIVSNGESK